jgi:hypothetical protein
MDELFFELGTCLGVALILWFAYLIIKTLVSGGE